MLSWAAFPKQNGLQAVASLLCSLVAEVDLKRPSFQFGQPQKNGQPFPPAQSTTNTALKHLALGLLGGAVSPDFQGVYALADGCWWINN